MVACYQVGQQRAEEFQFACCMLGASGRVIDFRDNLGAFFEVRFGSTSGGEVRLKFGGVFSEVMPQSGEPGPIGGMERGGKFCGGVSDVVEMVIQQLPVRLVWVGRTVGAGGGVSVGDYAQNGVDMRMILAWGVGHWRGYPRNCSKTRSRGEWRSGRCAELRRIASVSQQYTERTTAARHGVRGRATANVSVYNLSVCRKNSGARVA